MLTKALSSLVVPGGRHQRIWSVVLAADIGMVLADLGRPFQAVEFQKQALKAQERIFGLDHSYTCWTRDIVKGLERNSEPFMVLR